MDKEKLLRARVQEMCDLMEKGRFRQTRIFFIPQWQNKSEEEWREHISGMPDTEGLVNYYKIKDIKFRGEIAEVFIDSSIQKIKYNTYDYWAFTQDNWYIVDWCRSKAVSSDVLEKYKKLIKNNQR
jgi:hypothetical protein